MEQNSISDRPRLRVVPLMADLGGRKVIVFQDESRISEEIVTLPVELVPLISLLDGTHTLREIQEALLRETGELIMSDKIQEVLDFLDQHLLLDSHSFREYISKMQREWDQSAARPSSHSGTAYPPDPDEIRTLLDSCYEAQGGPGKPDSPQGPSRSPLAGLHDDLKGILAPHMNPGDTGTIYAQAYKALIERSQASLFIILGTGHFEAQQSFVFTEKDYATPLGTATTDRKFIKSVKGRLADCTERSDMSHRKEHSIEFQVLFLQHALEGRRDFMIVPLLVSSLGVSTVIGESPSIDPAVRNFLDAMRDTLSEEQRQVCLITSGDLAHLGPQYGDPRPMYPIQMDAEEQHDREMLAHAESGDPEGFFQAIAKIKDSRRVCGFPPLYVMLWLMGAQRGELLKWDYWHFEQTHSMVTMAAMAFY